VRVTARSEDGAWLAVYLGAPGTDVAWAPATRIHLDSPANVLPIAGCSVAVASIKADTSAPEATPPLSVAGTILPPPGSPAASTSPASAKPSATPKPSATTKATRQPTAPPTPPPTPTPTPQTDFTEPEIGHPGTNGQACDGGIHVCIWRPSAACSDLSAVVVSDSGADIDDPIQEFDVYFQAPGASVTKVVLTFTGGISYQGTITAKDSWNDGQVVYWAQAVDTHGNFTPNVFPVTAAELFVGQCP
jgi:hypothetical protein